MSSSRGGGEGDPTVDGTRLLRRFVRDRVLDTVANGTRANSLSLSLSLSFLLTSYYVCILATSQACRGIDE